MQAIRDKKLCYYCDEKYELRHKCKKRRIYLLKGEEEGETSGESDKLEEEEEKSLVSIHVIAKATSHQTMRIRSNNKKKDILIMIDLGSTHNFLDVTMAKRSGYIIQQDKLLVVAVADVTKIASTTTCK